MAKHKPRLVIATTVPNTMAGIMGGLPRWLAESFDVHLVTSPGDAVARIEKDEGIVPETIPMHRGISPLKDLVAIWRMYRYLRRVRPDIVHSYTPKAGLVAMIAARLAGVKVRVHTFTGLLFPTAKGKRQKVLIGADRLIARAASIIVPEGQGVKRDLETHRITTKPLKVIGNGNIAWVDLSQFNPERAGLREGAAALREKLGLSEAAFVFGFMGRLNRDKGINELVDAFHQLDDDACRLVLFGRHDETALVEPETRETIETDPRIIAAGWTDEVPCALTIFDALVLPSYREGFPNVLLQGSAMGVPLIATDINGSNEIVVPGETGYLVPARDAGALADAMRELIRLEGAARSAMGAAGKARVEALYEQSKYRAALMSFYFAALGAEHR